MYKLTNNTNESIMSFNGPFPAGTRMCYTSEYWSDESGEETASINTQVEHREKCTPLSRLKQKTKENTESSLCILCLQS